MPKANPAVIVWARETAGLTQEEAAKKLGFQDSSKSSAAEKLAALESGENEPSRPQLLKMEAQYRRPLLTFYLSKPPVRGRRGADFRTLPIDRSASDEALLDALVREIWARQSMVRAVLEDEDEAEPLPFIGSHRIEDGPAAVLASLKSLLGLDSNGYRDERNAAAAFEPLRRNAEAAGIFVLLKGDLGNHVSSIDTRIFRGFSIADRVAPFVVINDQDARPAWSFTLLHETVHLLLGQTGVSGLYGDSEVERFCNDIAGEFLLPARELDLAALDQNRDFEIAVGSRVSALLLDKFKVSHTMVAYKAFRTHLINQDAFVRLSGAFRREWLERRAQERVRARNQEGGPSYYTVRSHRLGATDRQSSAAHDGGRCFVNVQGGANPGGQAPAGSAPARRRTFTVGGEPAVSTRRQCAHRRG